MVVLSSIHPSLRLSKNNTKAVDFRMKIDRFWFGWFNGSDGHPALITIWNLLVAPTTIIAVPFQGCAKKS
jgi:hypothetical protein